LAFDVDTAMQAALPIEREDQPVVFPNFDQQPVR
jgi:hypothetical protein